MNSKSKPCPMHTLYTLPYSMPQVYPASSALGTPRRLFPKAFSCQHEMVTFIHRPCVKKKNTQKKLFFFSPFYVRFVSIRERWS